MEYKDYGPYDHKDGYIMYIRRFSNGKKRTILPHRQIMEEFLDRSLTPDENVHHINGDKRDNRIENLTILSHAEHAKLHSLEHPAEIWTFTCPECGIEFTKYACRIKDNQEKQGKAGPFCSKSCAGRYGQRFTPKKSDSPEGFQHGTKTGYAYHKCRCDLCRKAHNERIKTYQKKKRLEKQSKEVQ